VLVLTRISGPTLRKDMMLSLVCVDDEWRRPRSYASDAAAFQ
jgi:hypothetical protein